VINEQNAGMVSKLSPHLQWGKLGFLSFGGLPDRDGWNIAITIKRLQVDVVVPCFAPSARPLVRLAGEAEGSDFMHVRKRVTMLIWRVEIYRDFNVTGCVELEEVLGNLEAAETGPHVSQCQVECSEYRCLTDAIWPNDCSEGPQRQLEVFEAAKVSNL